MEYVVEAEVVLATEQDYKAATAWFAQQVDSGLARLRKLTHRGWQITYPVREDSEALDRKIGYSWRVEAAFTSSATARSAYNRLALYSTLHKKQVLLGSTGRVKMHECRHDENEPCERDTVHTVEWGQKP